jgi:hypothetical protein
LKGGEDYGEKSDVLRSREDVFVDVLPMLDRPCRHRAAGQQAEVYLQSVRPRGEPEGESL